MYFVTVGIEKEHPNIYIIDRGGINSAEAFRKMNRKEGLKFVGRLLENRKIKRIENVTAAESRNEFTYGSLCEDSRIQCYKLRFIAADGILRYFSVLLNRN